MLLTRSTVREGMYPGILSALAASAILSSLIRIGYIYVYVRLAITYISSCNLK